MSTKEHPPERKQTDESLAIERAEADHALRGKEAAIEQKADIVVERARAEADDVLTAARTIADEKLKHAASLDQTETAITAERAIEDQIVEDARAKADETLRRARAREANLARLLPLEREKTDLHLETERARADDALANRDDFLGMVSHDLRDLLNGIVMSASVIAEDAGAEAKGESVLLGAQRIQRSAARMTRLIGDLIDVASIEAGKLAVTPVPTDAGALILEAIQAWGPPAQAKGIVLESVARGVVPANVDSERILQVLGNLIKNAIKFSARGGKIVVGVDEVGGETRFSVTDTGVGITSDKLEAIFERFWQVGQGDRRGLGLGLYISRCIVEAHGGKIWAESDPGKGSTFFFTVPADRARSRQPL